MYDYLYLYQITYGLGKYKWARKNAVHVFLFCNFFFTELET